MSLVATVEALVRAGASPEMILEVVRVHEAQREDALAKRRASDAARQQKQRDRNVKSRDVTLPVNGHADTASRAHVVNTTSSSLRSEEAFPPVTPVGVTAPKGAKRPSKRAPEGWSPSAKTLTVLTGEGFEPGDLERALTRMRDHEFKTARSDWDATFRNWVRDDRDRNPRRTAHDRPDHQKPPTARDDRLGRMLRGAVASVDGPDVDLHRRGIAGRRHG